jgi:hypothetical protein
LHRIDLSPPVVIKYNKIRGSREIAIVPHHMPRCLHPLIRAIQCISHTIEDTRAPSVAAYVHVSRIEHIHIIAYPHERINEGFYMLCHLCGKVAINVEMETIRVDLPIPDIFIGLRDEHALMSKDCIEFPPLYGIARDNGGST